MILNVSGRTDIAFYSEWFFNRIHEGFFDVRNPFYPKLVNRIYLEDVDLIFFCTKNPLPFLKKIKNIEIPMIFHVTLTPYKADIEPNVPPKGKMIEAIKILSMTIGADRVFVRYDPILLNQKYTISYHKQAFKHLCSLLDGYVKTIIVSFIDDYKNVRKHQNVLQLKELSEEDYREIGISFSQYAKEHGMVVQTCFEQNNLVEYGFKKGECLSRTFAYQLTGNIYPKWKARKERLCGCVEMVDIGAYNSCKHFCKYCYANYDEQKIKQNYHNHDPKSSLLIGQLHSDDQIKRRR